MVRFLKIIQDNQKIIDLIASNWSGIGGIYDYAYIYIYARYTQIIPQVDQ